MATRRRAPTTRAATTRPDALPLRSSPALGVADHPEVVRSLLGYILLVLGAMTLIALVLPGRGEH